MSDTPARALVDVLLERAHERQPMDALLDAADPAVVRVAVEILAFAMTELVERRVASEMAHEDDLLEQVASQAAIILTLTDPGAAS